MFKNVFSKLFSGTKAEPAPPPSARGAGSKSAPAAGPEPRAAGKTEPQAEAKSKDKGRAAAPVPAEKPAPAPAGGGKPKAIIEWEKKAAKTVEKGADPKMLCGITDAMSREEIRDHLAMLYRRHNRAASSLDATLRAEAEIMLNAIVTCRDKLLK